MIHFLCLGSNNLLENLKSGSNNLLDYSPHAAGKKSYCPGTCRLHGWKHHSFHQQSDWWSNDPWSEKEIRIKKTGSICSFLSIYCRIFLVFLYDICVNETPFSAVEYRQDIRSFKLCKTCVNTPLCCTFFPENQVFWRVAGVLPWQTNSIFINTKISFQVTRFAAKCLDLPR